jgi:putative transposase
VSDPPPATGASAAVASQLLLIEVLRPPVESAQYTSFSFGRRLRESGILPSMGRTGTPADNAAVESFFDTMKLELLVGRRYRTREEAKAAIFEWMEVFYNQHRSTAPNRSNTWGRYPPIVPSLGSAPPLANAAPLHDPSTRPDISCPRRNHDNHGGIRSAR